MGLMPMVTGRKWIKKKRKYKLWEEIAFTDDTLAVSKYRHHKYRTRVSGTPFLFTFTTWVAWWEAALGHDWKKLRGRHKGQFVMARNGDKGPYHPSNVRCVTAEVNGHERIESGVGRGIKNHKGEHNPKSKLDPIQVLAIYNSKAKSAAVALEFDVSRFTVNDIRKGRSWLHLTKHMK